MISSKVGLSYKIKTLSFNSKNKKANILISNLLRKLYIISFISIKKYDPIVFLRTLVSKLPDEETTHLSVISFGAFSIDVILNMYS